MPVTAIPAGYSALIEAYELKVPLPVRLSAIGKHHRRLNSTDWLIMTPRHQPEASIRGHLTFALKYEGLDLAVLKRLFQTIGPKPIVNWVQNEPTGGYARRCWFLYEWLIGHQLDLPNAVGGRNIAVLDEKLQFGGHGVNSVRHRIKNNLPGNPDFCPLVFRTAELQAFCNRNFGARIREMINRVPDRLMARTRAFLLMKNSRASYVNEGENPPLNRIQQWGRAIAESGQFDLNSEELIRLQKIILGSDHFIKTGFRKEGGFIGCHDQETRMPIPDHINASYRDIDALINGMVSFANIEAQEIDPVIAASVLAFGFVYTHPFEDGNGRLHRYLFHDVLTRCGFNPPGVVFPLSSTILDRIDEYHTVLESYSKKLLPLIDWRETSDFNIEVINDTGDFYRFFDATAHATFTYECVQQSIEIDLPRETEFLYYHDEFCTSIDNMLDISEKNVDLLFRFLQQNNGRFSKRMRTREFAALTEMEVREIENIFSKFIKSIEGNIENCQTGNDMIEPS